MNDDQFTLTDLLSTSMISSFSLTNARFGSTNRKSCTFAQDLSKRVGPVNNFYRYNADWLVIQ